MKIAIDIETLEQGGIKAEIRELFEDGSADKFGDIYADKPSTFCARLTKAIKAICGDGKPDDSPSDEPAKPI